MATMLRSLLTFTLFTLLFSYVSATTITLYNKCPHPVWPGIQPSAGKPLLARGGFKLRPNKAYSMRLPPLWSGRFWGPEITLGQDQDFYDVSLVDGYNIAMSITPFKGSGKCSYAGCVSDLNLMCPVGLQVRSKDNKRVVACKSACFAFNSPRYCCTGTFGNPQSCKPTAYSKIFKAACPKAYSYAYDDPTSIATCTRGNYLVTFCPHRR
ncbi:hypothetical protein Goshw_014891 [Gossypium schwendimanii]|uniref:Thaumatin-like protein n=1 Tax=Gossypium schwendimanii TaxID=34291 RepID=A0A7J9LN64_GOSSC|nr:hypothetical protein [Gossypium schwendimanii]